MKIVDIRDRYISQYTHSDSSIQKVSTHLQWDEYKKTIVKKEEETLLLLDEQAFLWHHSRISISTTSPYSRSEYKKLLTEKTHKLQSEMWLRMNQIMCKVQNAKVNGVAAEFIVWEKWNISFDLCYYVLSIKYSDILWVPHISRAPRWYYLLWLPLLKQKSSVSLLIIDAHKTSLIQLENGRYKKISYLNAWDDLLRQAYEQAGLDPHASRKKEFTEHSLWEKLVEKAHNEYTHILMWRIQEHVAQWQDCMLISRLIQYPYFTQKLSESYIKDIKGRLIPYKGTQSWETFSRTWTQEELPVLLAFQKELKKYWADLSQ